MSCGNRSNIFFWSFKACSDDAIATVAFTHRYIEFRVTLRLRHWTPSLDGTDQRGIQDFSDGVPTQKGEGRQPII